MKKIGFILCLVFAGFAVNAKAAGYGAAGCGLGSLVFGQTQDWKQILAATTNGTFGSQTFGITFGTSECGDHGLVKLAMERRSFIEANYTELSADIAAGRGEYVETLAQLYNVSDNKSFADMLQKNYGLIFASNIDNAVQEMDKIAALV